MWHEAAFGHALGPVVYSYTGAAAVLDGWNILVNGHVEDESCEDDGLDCQLPSVEAGHEEGAGGAGAEIHMTSQRLKI